MMHVEKFSGDDDDAAEKMADFLDRSKLTKAFGKPCNAVG